MYHVTMKLPRWLVVSMLAASSLSIVAVACWWWVTWPERTARKFVEALSTGNDADAYAMVSKPYMDELGTPGSIPVAVARPPKGWKEIETQVRSIGETICGTQRFAVTSELPPKMWSFQVRLGTVTPDSGTSKYKITLEFPSIAGYQADGTPIFKVTN